MAANAIAEIPADNGAGKAEENGTEGLVKVSELTKK